MKEKKNKTNVNASSRISFSKQNTVSVDHVSNNLDELNLKSEEKNYNPNDLRDQVDVNENKNANDAKKENQN